MGMAQGTRFEGLDGSILTEQNKNRNGRKKIARQVGTLVWSWGKFYPRTFQMKLQKNVKKEKLSHISTQRSVLGIHNPATECGKVQCTLCSVMTPGPPEFFSAFLVLQRNGIPSDTKALKFFLRLHEEKNPKTLDLRKLS